MKTLANDPIIQRLRLAVNFDYVAVGGLDADGYRLGSGRFFEGDYPEGFVAAYVEAGLGKVDPLMIVGSTVSGPLSEDEAFQQVAPPKTLLELKERFGVRNRTLFPLWRNGVAYGAVCFCKSVPFTVREVQFLSFIAKPLHQLIGQDVYDEVTEKIEKLTLGERVCLTLSSNGMTSEEVAAASGYTVETVRTYIKSSIRKLKAANRLDAVVKAMKHGLIE